MKTLTKFMRNMGILVIVLLAVTIFNPLVVTKSNEYSLIIQFGKVVRVENSAGPSLRVPFLQSVQKIPKYKMISDLYPSDVTTKDKKVMTVDSFVIWDINDPVKYLDMVEKDGAPVNVMLFAGHQYFREAAGALDKYAPVTKEQQEHMKKGLEKALEAGCVGISYGLRYVPGTGRDEFLDTASCCEKEHRMISAHVRDDEDRVFGAVAEVAEAGKLYNIPVQVSHIGSMAGFGQMKQLLRQVDGYRMNGIDVACDCYPYFAFSTRIGATTYDDGWLERYHCDYSACQLTEGKYKGQRCTPETFAEMRRDFPECLTVCYVMDENDIRMAFADPGVMVGSDGLIDNGHGHPRAAGTFPRFLSEFVRKGDISLYDGIEKMTAAPAKRLGLSNKGRLNVGADADVVIFDMEKIQDGANFDDPMIPPTGIDYVLIGGEVAAKDCKIVKGDLGTALRKLS